MNKSNESKGRGRGLGRGSKNKPPKPNQENKAISIEQPGLKKSELNDKQTSNKESLFPKKPKNKFSLGQDFEILVNHFKLSLKKQSKLFQYDVTIKSEKGVEILSYKLGKYMLKEFSEKNPLYQNKILYDFKKILYCTESIGNSEFQFKNTSGRLYTAFFQEANRSSNLELNSVENPSDDLIYVLQMILTQNMRCSDEFFNFGKKFFRKSEKNRKKIGIGLDQVDGVSISVRPTEQGAAVNLNKISGSINQEGKNLIEILCEFFKCEKIDLIENLNDGYKNTNLENFFKNLDLVDHLNRRVQIENISNKNSQEHTFKFKDREISVDEYFREKYEKRLNYPQLPLLKIDNDNYIPLEVCNLQLSQRSNLNQEEQSEMIRHSNIKCSQRKKRILDLVEQLNFNENDPVLKEYGIEMDTKMTELTAKKINGATLEYGKDSKIEAKFGRWNIMNKCFYDAKEISNCVLIDCSNLDQPNLEFNLDNFAQIFSEKARNMQLIIKNPIKTKILEGNLYNFITEMIRKTKIELLMVINNGKDSNIYNILKQIGDIEYGIVTQYIDQSTISKQIGQKIKHLCSNICLKVNCKLGGTNFRISTDDQNYRNYLKDIFENDSMIFGIDVNHPTSVKQQETKKQKEIEKENKKENKKEKDYESIAAVVGSVDKNFCIYPASVLIQRKKGKCGLETVYHLNQPVFNLLKEYQERNKKLPNKLIFFRDGISDGQFSPVSQHELSEIRKACENIKKDYRPKISYIVVQKRHQTRFFPLNPKDQAIPKNKNDGKDNENVPPGTIVDTTIVTPDKFDFFICSHLGIQGTSKPCHYYLLFDENNFDSNKLIILSFYLCHINARSTTSVSYPAPTYYADLCAERGRKYNPKFTHEPTISSFNETDRFNNQIESTIESALFKIHENLRDKMFYI